MPVVLAAAAAAVLTQSICAWDRPGVDRYRGSPAAALAHYRDIPAADRAELARRIAAGIPDDTVAIGRRSIVGNYRYDSRIADMHFGAGRMCRTVTRERWAAAHTEPGDVYCVGGECVLVPRVCGNVSRIRRLVSEPGAGAGKPAPGKVPPPHVPLFTMPADPAPAAMPPPVDTPSWLGPGAPPAPLPTLGYPGPGRETFTALPPIPAHPVPEPATWAMLCLGLLAVVAGRRRCAAGRAARSR